MTGEFDPHALAEEWSGQPVGTIIFDIGGVLVEFADPPLFAAMGRALGRDPRVIEQAVLGHPDLTGVFTNRISELDFFDFFFKTAGLTRPYALKDARALFIHPEIYQAIQGMQELVRDLTRQGIPMAAVSDCIPPLVDVVRDNLLRLYPEIPRNHIFISGEIGLAKRQEGASALSYVLKKLGVPPSKVLFIDDILSYTTAARTILGMNGFTFVESPVTHTPPQIRLREGLRKAGLLPDQYDQ